MRIAFFSLSLFLLSPAAADFDIYCLNVGQGDATIVVSPSGQTLLMDGGNNGKGNSVVIPFFQSHGISDLDYMVASHLEADHIGGLDEVAESFMPVIAYDHGGTHDTITYQDYAAAIASVRQTISAGHVINLGGGVTATCLCVGGNLPGGQSVSVSDENDRSVGLLVEYDDFDFWVSGDLGGGGGALYDVESAVAPHIGDVDVLRVNHHGSSTSSNSTFLQTLLPEIAVISVGNNSYGHPTQDVLDRIGSTSTVQAIVQTAAGSGGTHAKVLVANDHIHIHVSDLGYSVTGGSVDLFIGDSTPTPTPSATRTPVPATTTRTPTHVATITSTWTQEPTPTSTKTPYAPSTWTPTPSSTAAVTETETPTATSTQTPQFHPNPDFDGDLFVGPFDLLLLVQGCHTQDQVFDLNGDDLVSHWEVFLFASHWYQAVPPTPTPSETSEPTATATVTATLTATSTETSTLTDTPQPTSTSTDTPTETEVPSPTFSPIPTSTATSVPTPSYTATETTLPTATDTPVPPPSATWTPTRASTATPTATSTATPIPTNTASRTFTKTPTRTNTLVPQPPRIELYSCIPNPAGTDAGNEKITVINRGSSTVNLAGWSIWDIANHHVVMSGTIGVNQTRTFTPSSAWVNNTGGETLYVKNPGGQTVDTGSYSGTIGDDEVVYF